MNSSSLDAHGARSTSPSGLPTLVIPPPISEARIAALVNAGVPRDIAEVDLEMVKLKLRHAEEGEGWAVEQAEAGELAYKRFLHLNRVHGSQSIVPTGAIDTVWHYHILDTRRYHADTTRIFGGYFHHFPYFGLRGEQDAVRLERAFRETERLWRDAFGEDLVAPEATGCWHDCSGRCWHACSSDDATS
jgi:hypothetical protein